MGEIERGEVTVTIVMALKIAQPRGRPWRPYARPSRWHVNPYSPDCVEGIFSEVRIQRPAKTQYQCKGRPPSFARAPLADHNIRAECIQIRSKKFTPGVCRWHHDASTLTDRGKAMAPNPLVGTWRLVSWENRSVVDGRVSYPLGEAAVGYIMYGEDGHMSVTISRPDRAKFATEDLLGGDAEEKARAAGTYVSYCGRYEFRGDTVVHRVKLSLFPNWVGIEQESLVEIEGNRLTLSTRPILLGGVRQTAHLIWGANSSPLLPLGFADCTYRKAGSAPTLSSTSGLCRAGARDGTGGGAAGPVRPRPSRGTRDLTDGSRGPAAPRRPAGRLRPEP
jgi:Lipocalin-like domain